VWTADPSGQYSTKSAYNVLRGETLEEIRDRAFEELWKLKVPTKISAFPWRLLKDRLPSKANLRRRQIELDDSTCPFCRNMEESVDHLFFHYNKILPV